MPSILVFSISSDIGCYVAKRFSDNGFKVFGTYRSVKGKESVLV